jgi:hypothetical protein
MMQATFPPQNFVNPKLKTAGVFFAGSWGRCPGTGTKYKI